MDNEKQTINIDNSKTFTDLKNAIDGATDTLTLDSDYKMTEDDVKDFQYGIKINKNITINGNGYTIDANKLGTIFNVGYDVIFTLANVTLANANVDSEGGAIDISYGKLVFLKNVTFVNNSAQSGGAIYNDGASLNVSDCSFDNNVASYNDGGAIYNAGASLNVSGCVFVNNSAERTGGAIYNYDGSGFTVSNSTFVNNNASNDCSAIYSSVSCTANDNWWGTNDSKWDDLVNPNVAHVSHVVLNLTATNSKVTVNFYRNGTSTVLPISRSLTLTIGDKTENKEIINGKFSYNYTAPKGSYNITAVVDNEKQIISMDNSTSGNTFTDLQNEINSKSDNSVLDLEYDYKYDGTTDFDGITITKNNFTIDGHGHTLDANPGNNHVRIFLISGTNVTLKNLILINAKLLNGGNRGGAIAMQESAVNCTVAGNTFINNSATQGGVIYNLAVNCTVSNNTFINNSAIYGGVIRNDGDCIVSNNTFISNSASSSGGVILNVKYCVVSNNTFINNTATQSGDVINSIYDVVANDNWWGVNDPKWDDLIYSVDCIITHDSFAVLNLTATNNKVTVNFYRNGTNTVLPISRSLTLTVGDNTTTEQIVNGSFSKSYTISLKDCKIVAVVDNEKLTIDGGNTTDSITGDNLTKYYENATQFQAKFLNNNGENLINTNVTFGIHGVNYPRTTDSEGVAKLNITLLPGIYSLVAHNPVTNQSKEFNVTVLENSGFMNVTHPESIRFGENTTINIKLPDTVNGNVNLTIDTENYTINIINGVGNKTITDLSIGTHAINATFKDDYYGLISKISSIVVSNNQTSIKTFTDLQKAIDGATGTLNLNSDYKMTEDDVKAFTYGIPISKNIVINGNGHTIDANKLGIIFNLAGSYTISLSNLTLANGSGNCAGAIYVGNGIKLTLDNVAFINNSANVGGAIYNSGNLVVSNSIFVNNSANKGGAIDSTVGSYEANDNWWGTNNPDWGKLINAFTTPDNHAVLNLTADNGVVYVNFYRNGTTTVVPISRSLTLTIGDETENGTIVNGQFSKVYTAPAGSYNITAVVDNEKQTITMGNSTAIKTFTDLQKAIEEATGTLTLDCDYKNTDGYSEMGITISKDIVINGNGHTIDANKLGRIFLIKNCTVTLANLTFINGKKNNANGGAIFIDTDYADVANFTVINCTFINNSAHGNGVISCGRAVNSTIKDCTFINNTAVGSNAGAVSSGGMNFKVINSVFINNTAKYNAGAIYNWGMNFTAINSTFINNKAGNGGAIANSGKNSTVVDSTFINNTASISADAIYNWDEKNCSIAANDNWWGTNNPVWAELVNGTVYHDSFAVLNVTGDNDVVSVSFFKNGTSTIVPISRSLTLTIGDKTENREIVDGQFSEKYTAPAGTYTITAVVDSQEVNVSLVNNNQIYVDPVNGDDSNNGSSADAPVKSLAKALELVPVNGKIYLADGTYVIDNQIAINKTMAIVGNGDKTVITNNRNGKGIFNITADKVAIYDCTFVNNTISDNGGVIDNDGIGFTVYNSIFINNTATIGGVIRNSADDITVSNSIFINNIANGGGVIHNSADDITVCNSIFINNTAKGGGVIYNRGDNFTVYNSNFTNNSGYGGGVIYNLGNSFTFCNSIFINNTAFYGGVIDNQGVGTHFIVDNNTFINNSATMGGVIYNHGDGVYFMVSNNIFTNDTANQGHIIYNIHDNIEGIINLINNTYYNITDKKTYIYNEGIIISPVTITVLGNETVGAKYKQAVFLTATIETADGASVNGGVLKFIVNGNNCTALVNDDGVYDYVYIADFIGEQVVNATYAGAKDANVETGVLNVSDGQNVDIVADDIVMIYHDGTRLVAKLVDLEGNPIANATLYITINGITYNRTTDSNGTASMTLNLEARSYNANIFYNGSDVYFNASKNITVTINPAVVAEDLVMMYQDGSKFKAKFLGIDGKPLAKTDIQFNINGVVYTKTTDDNGTASLNINLRPGNYIITAINPENDEQIGYNITVESLIKSDDLTKYYRNATKFQATIYNKDGSLAIRQNVTFNVNGVLYTKTTDDNGVASLGINLKPGNYTITTIFDGLSIGNNIEVLPTLLTSDLSMSYHDGSKFNATVLDGQGKPLVGQNVTFNVNGRLYTKVSNDDGVASLSINLNKGVYIITSMWNDYQVGNNITIA